MTTVRQSSQSRLNRAAEVLRAEGVKGLWFRALGETVYRRMTLVERLLNDPVLDAHAAVPVTVTVLQPNELAEYLAFRPGADAGEIRDRLDRGYQCFLARHNGALVNSCWAAIGAARIDYLGCEIQLADDEAYIFENYTAPGFRNRNIPAVRGSEMVRQFLGLGYFRFVGALVPENKASFRPGDKVGYRRFGVIGYVKVGPWRRIFCRVHSQSRPLVIRRIE